MTRPETRHHEEPALSDEIVKQAAETASHGGLFAGMAGLVTALGTSVGLVLRAAGASGKLKVLAETVEKLEGRVSDHDTVLDALKAAGLKRSNTPPPSLRGSRVPASVDRRLDALEAWRATISTEFSSEVKTQTARYERLAGMVEGAIQLITGGRRNER